MSSATLAELVKQARSIRRFVEADPIPADEVRRLVDIARCVPSASNAQPLRYRLVTEPAERANVFPHLKWASALKYWIGPKEGERPTAYILIAVKRGKQVDCDLGIAAQTIQLAATAAGYGACMLGAIDREALRRAFRLGTDMEVALVIALGRPGEKVVLEDLAPDSPSAYWRSPDEVHHVPKRRLEDVLLT
jgi:nitroreductase